MRLPRTQTLVLLGVVVGFGVIVVAGAHFAPGDAGQISGGVPYESPTGMEVKYYGDTNVSMENMFPAADTVDINSEAGNITIRASSDAAAAIHTSNITGDWTNVTAISAGSTWVEVYPADKARVDTRGSVRQLSIRSIGVDDGQADFWYEGPDGATADARLYNLPADQEIGAYDAATGQLLDGAMTDSAGTATFELPTSSHAVELRTAESEPPSVSNPSPDDGATVRSEDQTLTIDVSDPEFSDGDRATVTFAVNGSTVDTQTISSAQTVSTTVGGLSEGSQTWSVTVEDSWGNTVSESYSFTVDHYDPVISNPAPVGLLDTNPSDIEADISDADFAGDGDSLTVDIALDGSEISSQTINSNQTVSAAIPDSGLTGGQHSYTVTVTDSWGKEVERTETYSVPDTLTVRNELDHSDLVGSVSSNITFFGDENIYSRTTTNSTLQMTGLPVNQDFVALARPSDSNWTTRSLYVDSIYEQQSIYLLNTSAVETVDTRFTLQDPTGQYDSNSVLAIQRAINVSGTTEWQTVHADQFGSEGITVTLQEGVRYRTRITSEDGTEQIVGPYRPEVAETVTIQPGAPEIDIPSFEDGYGYNAGIDNTTVEYRYDDPENATDSVTVWIHEKDNKSNQLVANSTFFDVGSVYNEFEVSSNESEQTWVVNYVIQRDGEQIIQSVTIANQRALFSSLAPGLQASLGVLLLLLLAGSFSVLNAGVGAIVVSIASGLLWWVGLLSGVTSAVLISLSLFVSVVYWLARNSGP